MWRPWKFGWRGKPKPARVSRRPEPDFVRISSTPDLSEVPFDEPEPHAPDIPSSRDPLLHLDFGFDGRVPVGIDLAFPSCSDTDPEEILSHSQTLLETGLAFAARQLLDQLGEPAASSARARWLRALLLWGRYRNAAERCRRGWGADLLRVPWPLWPQEIERSLEDVVEKDPGCGPARLLLAQVQRGVEPSRPVNEVQHVGLPAFAPAEGGRSGTPYGIDISQLPEAQDELDPERQIEILSPLLSAPSTAEAPATLRIELMRRLANAHQDRGDLQEAHSYRVDAAKLAADPASKCPARIRSWIEGDLGRSYVEIHEWHRAQEHFREALALAEQSGDEQERILCKLNLALTAGNTGELAECRKLEEEVLRWGKAHDDRYVLGLQHFNIAVRMRNDLRLDECLQHAEEALAHAIYIGNVPLQSAAQRLRGESLHLGYLVTRRQKYSNEAEWYLQQSRDEAAALGSPALEAQAALGLAELYEARHQMDSAFQAYESAFSALEKVRDKLGFEEFQLSFFRPLEPIYGRTVEFLLRQKRTEEAFRTAELLRSRLLLEALGLRRSDLSAWTRDQKLRLERVLDKFGRAVLNQRKAEASAARRDFLSIQEEQSLRQARWNPRRSPPVASFEAVQRCLRARDALLAYFVTDQSLVVFVATKEGCRFQHLPYPRSRLQSDIAEIHGEMESIRQRFLRRDLLEAWRERNLSCADVKTIGESEKHLQDRLERLYAILVAPVLAVVADRPHWVIVPHGPLHQLPWAALRSRGLYLVERHTLSLLPSASIGAVLGDRSPSLGEAVFFANPDPNDPDLVLSGAAQEAQAGCAALRAGPPPFLGAAATKDEFLRRAASASLVHFACHHLFDQEMPSLSFLKLAGGRGSDHLFAFEVSELELSARLVTLAACDSGQSQTAVGDEQMGMVRSFLSAGARSVVSALWPIEDDSTALLFSLFYRAARTVGLAKALAWSQRKLLRNPLYNLPYFWAPFVLSGEWKERLYQQKGES